MTRRLFSGFAMFILLFAFAAGAHATRFIDIDNGTVIDLDTDLIWQKMDDGTRRNWQDALYYCYNNTAALSGSRWRLPSIEELKSIINTPALSGREGLYWSSSSNVDYSFQAWCALFSVVLVSSANKVDRNYVRCVRGQY